MRGEVKFQHIKRLWYLKEGVIYTRYGNKAVSFSCRTSRGYRHANINVDGKQYPVCIHEAVFMLYHDRPIIKGKEIHHIDGNNQNNAVDNLIELTPTQHRRIHNYQCNDPMRGIDLYGKGAWRFRWLDDNGTLRSRHFHTINEAMIFRAEIEEPRRAELRAIGLNCKRSGSGPTNGTIRKISRPSRTRQWLHRPREERLK